MNLLGLFIVATGLFSAAGGIFNWDWFMNHRKARFMCSLLTRTEARVFYAICELGIVVLGTWTTLRILQNATRKDGNAPCLGRVLIPPDRSWQLCQGSYRFVSLLNMPQGKPKLGP